LNTLKTPNAQVAYSQPKIYMDKM